MKNEPVEDELNDSDSSDSLEEHHKSEVLSENLQLRRAAEKRAVRLRREAFYNGTWQWKPVYANAFGAFIQKGLHSGLLAALMQCGVMVCLSWIVPLVIAYELLADLPELDEPAAFGHCSNPTALQLASLGVWILMAVRPRPL